MASKMINWRFVIYSNDIYFRIHDIVAVLTMKLYSRNFYISLRTDNKVTFPLDCQLFPWLSHPLNTRKVLSSILSGNNFFFLKLYFLNDLNQFNYSVLNLITGIIYVNPLFVVYKNLLAKNFYQKVDVPLGST